MSTLSEQAPFSSATSQPLPLTPQNPLFHPKEEGDVSFEEFRARLPRYLRLGHPDRLNVSSNVKSALANNHFDGAPSLEWPSRENQPSLPVYSEFSQSARFYNSAWDNSVALASFQMFTDPASGHQYYVNDITGESSWEPPKEGSRIRMNYGCSTPHSQYVLPQRSYTAVPHVSENNAWQLNDQAPVSRRVVTAPWDGGSYLGHGFSF